METGVREGLDRVGDMSQWETGMTWRQAEGKGCNGDRSEGGTRVQWRQEWVRDRSVVGTGAGEGWECTGDRSAWMRDRKQGKRAHM